MYAVVYTVQEPRVLRQQKNGTTRRAANNPAETAAESTLHLVAKNHEEGVAAGETDELLPVLSRNRRTGY